MAGAPTVIERPQRWDDSFDPEMTEGDVGRLLDLEPFCKMRPENFPKSIPLRGILQHDVRLRRFNRGEIVVRQGDYGTSAFMVVSGEVAVVKQPQLPPSLLGRKERRRKGVIGLIAQLWSSNRAPESFTPRELRQDSRIEARGSGEEARIFLQDVPRILQEHTSESMGHGEFFGELAALSRMPRAATVFATSDEAELLEIRWQGLRDIRKFDDQLCQHIDEKYRRNALEVALRSVPLFRRLKSEDLEKVKEEIQFQTYGEYQWSGSYKELLKSAAASGHGLQEPVIAQEGDYPNGVVLIRSGFARLSQKFGNGNRTLNYLGAGQLYGLEEIAHNWRAPQTHVSLQYTLRVIGYTHVLVIPTAVMEKVVLPSVSRADLPPLIERTTKSGKVVPPSMDASAKIGPDMLEFLTENRYLNGKATMLIDLDRCTRCDDCVRACAATHDNNPRFLRHGPTSGKFMVANACMHCVDPICMIGCPTGAIHREAFAGKVTINPATCIGCSVCATNCPYGAIRMVEIRDRRGEFLEDTDGKTILKATKCDLCVEQLGGPACQRACPHGALARIDLTDLDSLAAWIKR
jgi:Fe-S-cluster-containing dehydrogenase component/CRP-like cAMP-binding protein